MRDLTTSNGVLTRELTKPDMTAAMLCTENPSGSPVVLSTQRFEMSYVASSPRFTEAARSTLGAHPRQKLSTLPPLAVYSLRAQSTSPVYLGGLFTLASVTIETLSR